MQERCLLAHCLNNETPYEGVTEVFKKETHIRTINI